MDAIKKKMQGMKLEKDNAMDRALLCEQQARDANARAEKAEEEARALQKKIQTIENDLDQTQEALMQVNAKLEEKDKAHGSRGPTYRRREIPFKKERFDRATITLHNYRSHWQGCSLGRREKKKIPVAKRAVRFGREKERPRDTREGRGCASKQRTNCRRARRFERLGALATGAVFPGLCARRHVDRRSDTRVRVCACARARAAPRAIGGAVAARTHAADAPRLATPVRPVKLRRPSSARGRDRSREVEARRRRARKTRDRYRAAIRPYQGPPEGLLGAPKDATRRARAFPTGRRPSCAPVNNGGRKPAVSGRRQCTTAPVPLRIARDPLLASMSAQVQGTLLDVLKKKMRQTKEEMEKYKDECEEYQRRLQVEVMRREEAESEVAALNRRIQLLEEDLERSEERLATATAKLAEASQAADESERIRKALENRTNMEDDRVSLLEQQLAQAKLIAEEADKKYEEVARKLHMMEQDLERAEEKAELSESKIVELEEELRVVGNNLKSLEVSEEKANQREEEYKNQIKTLTTRLKEAEARAEFAERSVQKLQKEVDRLEDELVHEKEKYKYICDDLDLTFTELVG